MPSASGTPTGKLPFVVWVLAAGTFLMGTTEFVIAGLLPEMAADLNVSVSHAGLLITAFAVGMIVGRPTMAMATLRLPQRHTLVGALAVFALGHAVAALSTSFTVVLTARVVTALATGAFWAVGFVIATTTAGPARATRAVGVMMGGLTLANVIGVPIGSFVGHYTGWRGPFWALAVLAAVAAAFVGRFIPRTEQRAEVSVRAEIRALRQTRLWLALGAAVLIMGGVLAVYTYITPLLTDRAGISAGAVPLVLIAFGIGALGGTAIGGRLGDRRPMVTTITASAATSLILLALIPASNSPVAAVVLVFGMALAGFTVNPVVTSLAVRFAGDAPTLTSALTTSGYNTGIAAGSLAAGHALDTSLGLTGPALVGAVFTALTLLPLTALALSATGRRTRIVAQRAAADPVRNDASTSAHH
ncbi:MFS transporter [Streptomyces sp. NPDC015501]|uniref:MFS transporter n=1 Tax=unclassified Streptomyces TaxID=2593676 RepID=UPI0011AADEA7|nr:MFS transporter [Streptomyces griseus subsp. griseus]